ncbi:unnamed protein product, partial [Owenia fusiformis]
KKSKPMPGELQYCMDKCRKCKWSEYGEEKIDSCSASCGGGITTLTRKRTKIYGYAETVDTYCYGSDTVVVRTRLCNIQPCWEPPPPPPPPTTPPPIIGKKCRWSE